MNKFLIFSFALIILSQASVAQQKIIAKKNYVKTKPNMLFCGKNEGFILLDSLKGTPILSVPAPYTLISTSVIFGGAGFVSPRIGTLMNGPNSGNLHLTALTDLLKFCTDGTKIAFLEIKLKKDKIIYDAPDMIFIVKQKL